MSESAFRGLAIRHRSLLLTLFCTPALVLVAWSALRSGSWQMLPTIFPFVAIIFIAERTLSWTMLVAAVLQWPVYGLIADLQPDGAKLVVGLHVGAMVVYYTLYHVLRPTFF